jgi:hypothetical protein
MNRNQTNFFGKFIENYLGWLAHKKHSDVVSENVSAIQKKPRKDNTLHGFLLKLKLLHDHVLPDIKKSKDETSRAANHQIKLLLSCCSSKGIDALGQSGNLSGSITLMNGPFTGGPIYCRNCGIEGNPCFFRRILLNGHPNGLDRTLKY